MPAPSRIRDTPTARENTLGLGVSVSRRNADTNKLKRSITNPRPISAKLLRCHARSVRSAANNTRGSGGLDMMKHPRVTDRPSASSQWRRTHARPVARLGETHRARAVAAGDCQRPLELRLDEERSGHGLAARQS